MKFNTYEIRSDDEYTGNIFWITCSKENLSPDDALKSLWVEACEYPKEYSIDKINQDYRTEEKRFLNETMSVQEFLIKANMYISRIYEKNAVNDIMVQGKPSNEYFFFPRLSKKASIRVLESDSFDLTVFISDDDSYIYFFWTDVV